MSVLIIGLLPAQFQAVKHDFPALDLRLWATGSSEKQVARSANRVDRVIVMAGFISHKHTHRIDKHKTTLVHGGLTSLRAALTEIQESNHD